MPVPAGLGFGEEAAGRLVSQAAYELARSPGGFGEASTYLRRRIPGLSEQAISWALRTARKTLTATRRAAEAGTKATFGGLFRESSGISPGYTVAVRVSVTLPSGQVKSGTYLVPNVTNERTVESVRQEAILQSQRQYAAGERYPEGDTLRKTLPSGQAIVGRAEADVVSIIAASGAP